MSLEDELKKMVDGAQALGEEVKDTSKEYVRVRRKSKDLTEALGDIHDKVSDMAEAASIWRTLGGFKRNRRNSKDLSEDTLKAAFAALDADNSGKIDRDELKTGIQMENASLKDEQIEALINFADADQDGEISFEEYKTIMAYQSGVK